jgi:hypothetical protein
MISEDRHSNSPQSFSVINELFQGLTTLVTPVGPTEGVNLSSEIFSREHMTKKNDNLFNSATGKK